jgi:tripartite-type tricarboxylate transporter receptor subunit TctC
MSAALAKVLASAQVQEFAKSRGLVAHGTKPQELDAQIAADGDRVGKLIREHGIKVQ